MNKWEYTKDEASLRNINILGALGWELCSISNNLAYFKRPLVEKKVETKPKVAKPNKEAPLKVGDWVARVSKYCKLKHCYKVSRIVGDEVYIIYRGVEWGTSWEMNDTIRVSRKNSEYQFIK